VEGFELCGLRFYRGTQGTVVEGGEFLAAAYAVSNADEDADDSAVTLGGDVGLLLGYEGAGGPVGNFRWFGRVKDLWRWCWCFERGRG
jgi:hypothetical protein